MANQSRNEMDRGMENSATGSSPSTTSSSSSSWGGGTQQGMHGGDADRNREDFYRRAERGRGYYNQGEDRGGRYTQGGTYGGPSYGGYGAESYNRGGMHGGYGSETYNRGGATQGGYMPEPRGGGWSSQGSSMGNNEAYGDYGHPGEDGRFAYGDMGMGGATFPQHHAQQQHQQQTMRQPGGGAQHGGGLMDRLMGRTRRWRRGNQVARDVMTRNPRCARPNDTVQQIAQVMVDEDTGIVPIVGEDNRLLGVVTDRDIVCRLLARGVDMKSARATDVMTDDVECVTEQDSLSDVLRLMSEHQIRRIPVVARNDRLVGIISMADIAREADVDEQLQDTFDEISSDRGFWSRLR